MVIRTHSSHVGFEACLRRARECLHWLEMNADITKHVQQCVICCNHQITQQKETLKPHELNNRPWAKSETDLFACNGHDFLVTVDYYSNFWEVDRLEDTSSVTVIRKLKAHFARYGIPETVVSDNGPQYSATEFAKFARL